MRLSPLRSRPPRALLAALAGLALAASARAAGAQAAPAPMDVPKDMTPYVLAFFVRPDSAARAAAPDTGLVRRHLAYMRRQIELGRYVTAGPLADRGRIEGLVVVAARTVDEARALIDGDPMVAAGHVGVELHRVLLPSLAALRVRY
jgi:uncharacterized protein YciI